MDQDTHRLSEAIHMAMRMHELGARQSGRTSRMVERVRDGEMVVCLNAASARRMTELLRQQGKHRVRVVTSAPQQNEFVSTTAGYSGRLHLDHSFVWEWFSRALIDARNELDGIAKSRDTRASTNDDDLPGDFRPNSG